VPRQTWPELRKHDRPSSLTARSSVRILEDDAGVCSTRSGEPPRWRSRSAS